MKPIYKTKGAAHEYGELALNIYTGCPHRCFYCYVPNVLRCDREKFHTDIRPRPNIIEETRKQLERERITDKLIHLCFTCDPYPTGCDSSVTREIIKLLKEYGNHVQILTKGNGSRDFDLLDLNDFYGITLDGSESNEEALSRVRPLKKAHDLGINTWISFEPVIDPDRVLWDIAWRAQKADKIMIGKLNYHKSNVDWKAFGHRAESMCKSCGKLFYIKDSLRKEMEK